MLHQRLFVNFVNKFIFSIFFILWTAGLKFLYFLSSLGLQTGRNHMMNQLKKMKMAQKVVQVGMSSAFDSFTFLSYSQSTKYTA